MSSHVTSPGISRVLRAGVRDTLVSRFHRLAAELMEAIMDGKDPTSLDVGYFAGRITLATDTLDASRGRLGDTVPRDGDGDGEPGDPGEHIETMLTMLPSLTRAVYLLASVDDLTFREIAWRCGIDVAEVERRLADALYSISRDIEGRPKVAMKMRATFLAPSRSAWARWRLQRRPQLSIDKRASGA